MGGFEHKLDVVDLGCGDFSIGSQVRHLFGEYTAYDIFTDLIEENIQKWKDLRVNFHAGDITKIRPPKARVAILRQVLQRLSSVQIMNLIKNMDSLYDYLICTEHLPLNTDFIPNLDKVTDESIRLVLSSGVDLRHEPFNLRYKEQHIIDEVKAFGGRIVTTVFKL